MRRGIHFDRDPNLNALDISVLNQLKSLVEQPKTETASSPTLNEIGLEAALKELLELEQINSSPQEHQQCSEES